MPDVSKIKVAKDLGRQDIWFGLARKPASDRVFVGSSDFKLYDVDMGADKPEAKPVGEHESYVTSVALAAGGSVLVSGGYDCKLRFWDAGSYKSIRAVEAHAKAIRSVVASPDGKLVASVADDMICKLWDAATGKLVRELKGHDPITPHHFPSMLYAVTFSADGKLLATGDKTGRVCVWNTADGKELARLDSSGNYTWDPTQRRHSIGGIRSLAFSPDGATLAVGGTGKIGNIDHLEAPGRLEVFDWKANKSKFVLSLDGKNKGLVEQLAFAPDGSWLVGAGGAAAGFIAFFDVKAGKILFQDSAPMHVHGLAISEKADKLYASGHGKMVVWSLPG
jgi:WD40 repeat protein